MIIVIVILVVALGFVAGVVVRQRRDLHDNVDAIKWRDLEIERLINENETLRRDRRDFQTNLEMVLSEFDKSE